MSERYAVRNIRLCTKDCLCLYVCPTGATDTENSVIDLALNNGLGAVTQKNMLLMERTTEKLWPLRWWRT